MIIDWIDVLAWGFVAGAAMVIVESCGLWLGWTRLNTCIILGSFFWRDRDRAAFAGTIIHLCTGWIFALVYAALFAAAGFATWWLGLLFGIGHALLLLIVILPVLPAIHPRMASPRTGPEASRALQAPGVLGLHYGRPTALVSTAAHATFGCVFGLLYQFA